MRNYNYKHLRSKNKLNREVNTHKTQLHRNSTKQVIKQ